MLKVTHLLRVAPGTHEAQDRSIKPEFPEPQGQVSATFGDNLLLAQYTNTFIAVQNCKELICKT